MSSKKRSRELLKIGVIVSEEQAKEVFNQIMERFGPVIFYPFYDRGELRGYALQVREKKVKNPGKLRRGIFRETAIWNACHHERKRWVRVQRNGVSTEEI